MAAVALAHQLAQQELTAANVAQQERRQSLTNLLQETLKTMVSCNTNVTYSSIACNPADPAAGASSAALPSAGGGGGGGGGSGAGAAVAVAQGADEASAECKSALQARVWCRAFDPSALVCCILPKACPALTRLSRATCKWQYNEGVKMKLLGDSDEVTLLQRAQMSEETASSAKASSIETKEPPAKTPRIIEIASSSSLIRTLLENEQPPLKKPRVIEAAGAEAGGGGHVSSSTAEKPTCIARPCASKAAATGGKAGGMQEKVEEKTEEKMEKGELGGRAQCSNGCEGDDNGVVRWCVPCKRYDNIIYYAMYIIIFKTIVL